MKDSICLALDVRTQDHARKLVSETRDYVGVYKVGLELFSIAGPQLVRTLVQNDIKVFLDLKLHDIPTTMARAIAAIGGLGVRYLTIHAAAGEEAMADCADAAEKVAGLRLLAVTVLTSDAQSRGTGNRISSYAMSAARSGIMGFVCSAKDIRHVRVAAPRSFVVTPGIRPEGSDHDDQKRVLTPVEALEAGSNLLVIGRPIRDAESPREAARAIYESIGGE